MRLEHAVTITTKQGKAQQLSRRKHLSSMPGFSCLTLQLRGADPESSSQGSAPPCLCSAHTWGKVAGSVLLGKGLSTGEGDPRGGVAGAGMSELSVLWRLESLASILPLGSGCGADAGCTPTASAPSGSAGTSAGSAETPADGVSASLADSASAALAKGLALMGVLVCCWNWAAGAASGLSGCESAGWTSMPLNAAAAAKALLPALLAALDTPWPRPGRGTAGLSVDIFLESCLLSLDVSLAAGSPGTSCQLPSLLREDDRALTRELRGLLDSSSGKPLDRALRSPLGLGSSSASTM